MRWWDQPDGGAFPIGSFEAKVENDIVSVFFRLGCKDCHHIDDYEAYSTDLDIATGDARGHSWYSHQLVALRCSNCGRWMTYGQRRAVS